MAMSGCLRDKLGANSALLCFTPVLGFGQNGIFQILLSSFIGCLILEAAACVRRPRPLITQLL